MDPAGLVGREQPIVAPRRRSPTVEEAIPALGEGPPRPDIHRLPLHADHFGRLRLAQPRCSISIDATRPFLQKPNSSMPET